ncbi:MAG: 1-acyl-sn-glycerol-3-phosphate acyltransferase [Bacteroidales bacterium]|nr:1-acyl-sn-glycerol-3-phosphate acyltransferase [Bacteroidales bacterium]
MGNLQHNHQFRTIAGFLAIGFLIALVLLFVIDISISGGFVGKVTSGKPLFPENGSLSGQDWGAWQMFYIPNTGLILWILASVSFIILLLVSGRIELTLISMIPILAGWYGLNLLTRVQENGTNYFFLKETALLFGLVTGYSLYLIRGLVNSYKTGESRPPAIISGLFYILLSVLVLLSLLWVAGHPVVSEGTLVTVAGISATLALSGALVPVLFESLVYHKKNKRVEPVTLTSFLVSIIAFLMFLTGSLLLTMIIPLLRIVPVGRDRTRYIFHWLVSATLRIVVYSIFPIRKVIEIRDKVDFSKPSVIVCNHQSHLDLSIILMLHPKIIVLTNKWVWNNPFYGFVVRFAEFYPIFKGLDPQLAERLGKKVAKGYSILVFPEGTRTNDGQINRFHQGAFWLADKLNIDIQPMLLHGANHCMIKREFFLRPGMITLRALRKIKVTSVGDDESYRLQAQALRKIYRREFEKVSEELETPDYFRNRLLSQFLYKGPVIEWYARVKVRLEKNYKRFNSIIPLDATIVDIGCGYGFLSHMLCMVSDKRRILGLDYDSEKIAVAGQIDTSLKNVRFEMADILNYELPAADVFLLLDVLHYLPAGFHRPVIEKCMNKLNSGGMIIIRDADTDLTERMWRTRLNEFYSTRFFRFNKTRADALSFTSGTIIADIAAKHNFVVERDDKSTKKADITFVLKRAEK